MRVWTIANQKGGVAKTTTTVCLGGLLAAKGYRVLLIDLDPHGSLTSYFRYDLDGLDRSSYNLFQLTGQITTSMVQDLVHTTSHKNLKLIPAATALATVERQMHGQEGLGLRISRAVAQLRDEYDFILIDTAPILGVLMINALAACEHLLVPVQTEHLAIKGLERMQRTIMMVNRSRQRELRYTIIPTMYDRRTHASVESLRILKNGYRDNVWASMIPVDTKFRDASKSGLIPSEYDGESRGVLAYSSLLKYLVTEPRRVPEEVV